MRTRTAVLLFGAAAATGAAVIGAATAALVGRHAAQRTDTTFRALSRAFFAYPQMDAAELADAERPVLTLVKSGPR